MHVVSEFPWVKIAALKKSKKKNTSETSQEKSSAFHPTQSKMDV